MTKRNKIPLSITHPDLMLEWDFEKNGEVRPEGLTFGVDKKVWWKCDKCAVKHSYCAPVVNKVGGGGCPYFAGRKVGFGNSLLVNYPELCEEWDKEKNKKGSDQYTPGSSKKVWWICKKEECRHSWVATVNKRVRGRKCPACSNKVVTNKNNLLVKFPELCEEWDYTNNSIRPDGVVPGTAQKVWWECYICYNTWKASILNRALGGTNCPYCVSKLVSGFNNLFVLFPEIAEEWDCSKNGEGAESVVAGSNRRVWWECKVCGYSWRTAVGNRTKDKGTNCPACSNQVVTEANNLLVNRPELCEEWDLDKNEVSPEEVVPGADRKVWWKCEQGHSWEALVYNRTGPYPQGCPYCANKSISNVSQQWLDTVGISESYREYGIVVGSSLFRVDGFDPETNTVYEFLGDFWHGNPSNKRFPSNEINTKVKKRFGQLHKETFNRLHLLEEAGYNVIYIWEKDYKEGKEPTKSRKL